MVNNAGAVVHVPVADASEEQFDTMIDMHLRGPVFLTQALLPIIADGGRILNVSTGFTRTTMAGFGLYAAAMAALETLTRFMALELGARQIRVNAIAPGAIATDFGGGRVRDDEQINAFVAGRSRSAASVSLTTSAVWSQQYWAMISAGPTVRSSMCRAACLSDPFRGQSRQPPVRSWPFGPASMLAGGILAEHRGASRTKTNNGHTGKCADLQADWLAAPQFL